MASTSSTSSPLIIAIEDYSISGNLNSSMLFNFLTGIYTMVYAGTLYIYLFKKSSNINRRVVLTTISVLYIISFINFIIQWYYTDWTFVVHGDTRDTIFIASVGDTPPWLHVIASLLSNSSLVISDGLLIWRCFYVWGQSTKVIVVPSLLWFAEFALFVTKTTLDGLFPIISNNANADLSNNIATALEFVGLGTTTTTTFLIGYKIHRGSKSSVLRSQRAYKRIVATIIESSAVYSLVLIFYAITSVCPVFYTVESPLAQITVYIQVLMASVSGMAPTVMVARLALINTDNASSSGTITHISGLNFNSQQASAGVDGVVTSTGRRGDLSLHTYSEQRRPSIIEAKV